MPQLEQLMYFAPDHRGSTDTSTPLKRISEYQRQHWIRQSVAQWRRPERFELPLPEDIPDGYRIDQIYHRSFDGSMNVLYLASRTIDNKKVILKMATDDFADTDSLSNEYHLHQEADQLEAQHRSLKLNVQTPKIEYLEHGRAKYLVIEYLDPQKFTELSQISRSPLSAQFSLLMSLNIAMYIDAMAKKGLYHRDLKPGNLMINLDQMQELLDIIHTEGCNAAITSLPDHQCLYLIDFGLGFDQNQVSELSGRMFGTPSYMSRDRILNEDYTEIRNKLQSEIYVLILLLYRMLFGRDFVSEKIGDREKIAMYFDFDRQIELLKNIATELTQQFSVSVPSTPERIYQILTRGLQVDSTATTYTSATKMIQEMFDILSPNSRSLLSMLRRKQ